MWVDTEETVCTTIITTCIHIVFTDPTSSSSWWLLYWQSPNVFYVPRLHCTYTLLRAASTYQLYKATHIASSYQILTYMYVWVLPPSWPLLSLCLRVCLSVYLSVCMYVCMFVCMYVCTCMCVYGWVLNHIVWLLWSSQSLYHNSLYHNIYIIARLLYYCDIVKLKPIALVCLSVYM